MAEVDAAAVKARLLSELGPGTEVQCADISGCGASFEVRVVSPAFEGQRLLERHKAVNGALAPLMASSIHALSIKQAKTPAEVAKAAAAAQ